MPELARSPQVGITVRKLFLLSPAKIGGTRAGFLLNPHATFALARQLHTAGLPLGEVFSFASGLYFRGKLTYARHFANTKKGDVIRVITSNAGLVDPSRVVSATELTQFGEVDIDPDDPRYHGPLRRDAEALAAQLHAKGSAILLGSIATPKYRDVLLATFGARLFFPGDFVGRGDMSRGSLLLRSAQADTELSYVSVAGAVYHGKRAPRLSKKKDQGGPAS